MQVRVSSREREGTKYNKWRCAVKFSGTGQFHKIEAAKKNDGDCDAKNGEEVDSKPRNVTVG